MDAGACANMSSAGMEYAMCLEEADLSYLPCPDPSLCNISQSDDNVGLAFGLTIGAGLATTLGALLPFVPCIKRSNTLFLAIGLALAAGVMIYVSFTEIWKKSRDNFCCVTPDHFDLATTACFFGGIMLTVLLDVVVVGLQKVDCGCCVHVRARKCVCCFGRPGKDKLAISATNSSLPLDKLDLQNDVTSHTSSNLGNGNASTSSEQQLQPATETDGQQCATVTPDCVSVSVNSVTPSDNTINYGTVSVNELFSNSSLLRLNAVIPESTAEEVAREEEEEEVKVLEEGGGKEDSTSHVTVEIEGEHVGNGVSRHRRTSYQEMSEDLSSSSMEEALGPKEFREVTEVLGKSTKKLHRMGILTGLAIGIHNFPEGLATFVAALSSPSLGAALAVAIALHNIPEGLCVAMPVYYATGQRWKGFLWAFLSGISEPLGALLGWLVLRGIFGPLVYGISFGFISGMMVFISLKELLPTAYRFDKTKGQLVSGSLVVGMLVMAISLILFLY